MLPLAAMAVMAGLGLLKSEAVDRPAERRKRALRAEEIRYSPYSGIKNFTDVGKEADPIGSVLGGAAQGAGLGQGFEKADQEEKQNQAVLELLKGSDVNDPSKQNTPYGRWLQSGMEGPRPQTLGFLNTNTPPPQYGLGVNTSI